MTMAVSHGMNVDEVERLARQLRDGAARLSQLAAALDREVASTVWRGPDAERFKNDWWPSHRSSLLRVGEDLEGFGQSASNNAAEQRNVSTASGGPGAVAGAAGAAVAAGAGAAVAAGGSAGAGAGATAASGTAGAASSTGDTPGAANGALPGAHRSIEQGNAAYLANAARYGVGHAWSPTGTSQWQCTAWANYRWAELRAEHGLGTGAAMSGDGGQMARLQQGTPTTLPRLGAMISDPSENHVMIAEEITVAGDGGLSVRVSEFNYHRKGEGSFQNDRVLTLGADGNWVMPNGQTRTLWVANLK